METFFVFLLIALLIGGAIALRADNELNGDNESE